MRAETRRWRRPLTLAAWLGTATLLAGAMTMPNANAAAPAGSHRRVAGSWVPVWQDSFTGPAGHGVDQKDWRYDIGQGIFGTGEIETMTKSARNIYLDGQGNLDITALGHGQTWTSGRIRTRSSFAAPAGGMLMVTASIMQPNPQFGLGYWPAFWMLGPGSSPASGEVDILEAVNALSQHSGTLHCGNLTQPNPDGTFGPCHEDTGLTSGLLACPACQTGYHSYSVVIDRTNPADEQIRWYLDGQLFQTVSEDQVGQSAWTAAVDHGFSIIFDLAIGGGYPGGVCGCITPDSQTSSGGTMSIQYVAVYRSS